MALVLRDRVKETTSTAGTGTYSLAGAVAGFESFGSVGNGNTTYYGCSDGINFEVGIGTYTASGTTLARTTILQSSNSDNAVNWGTGTRTIFCTLPAEKMSFLDASGNLVANNASALTNLNASNIASGTVPIARIDTGTTAGKMIVLDGSARLPAVDGSQLFNVATGPADITADSFTGNNSTTAFTITTAPAAADDLLVTINGLIQRPTADYTVSGTTLTFTSVPFTGANIFSRLIGGSESTNGDLLAANNLSDVANASTSRTNLGVAIGSNVQAHSSVLDATTASYTTALNTKLGGIEASADVTDAANVTAAGALMDSEVDADIKTLSLPANTTISAYGATLVDDANAAAARTTLGLGTAATTASTDYATAAQGTAAAAALPKTGGAMTGAITTNSTFDGRDVGNDGTKLDGIEASADVTDTANVVASLTAGTNITIANDGTIAAAGGGGADLYAANESSPAAQPSASGGNAVAIGDSAISSGNDAISLGISRATGQHSFAAVIANSGSTLGARGAYSIAMGYEADTGSSSQGAVAIGFDASAGANYAVALGRSVSSGADSFAAVIANGSSSYGASGQYGIAMGYYAKANGLGSTSIGYQNTAAQSYSTAIGYMNSSNSQYSVSLGNENVINGNNGLCLGNVNYVQTAGGVAIGKRADARQNYQIAFAAGYFAANGDAQGSMYILRCDTTDATATVLTTTNAAGQWYNQITAQTDSCIMFSGTVVAMQNGAQDQGGWEVKGLLKNDGGTTTLVSSNIQTFADGNGWVVALSANNTTNSLAITCTGEASHNIRWVANISTSEVIYA